MKEKAIKRALLLTAAFCGAAAGGVGLLFLILAHPWTFIPVAVVALALCFYKLLTFYDDNDDASDE